MSKEILLIRNDDGEFELYDDTYDVVIHSLQKSARHERDLRDSAQGGYR